jgi:stage II sporulation protein D
MSAGAWLGAAVLSWHLSVAGALPREVPVGQVAPYAAGARKVRVLIFDHANELSLRPSCNLAVEAADGRNPAARVSAGAAIRVRPMREGALLTAGKVRVAAMKVVLRPLSVRAGVAGVGTPALQQGAPTTVSGWGGAGQQSRCAGDLEIVAVGAGLRVIEEATLEDYVAGVVAAELPASFPLEAAKAQAVAARTYALFHLGDHRAQGADLCGEAHCQAYRGLPPPQSKAVLAATQTAGQVLVWHGMLVDAMYHSACGGTTAAAWEVRQGKLLPYLCGTNDTGPAGAGDELLPHDGGSGHAFCAAGPGFVWERRYSWREADRLIAANLGVVLGTPGLRPGHLKSLKVVGWSRDGRVEWLAVEAGAEEYLVRGDSIRWLFGGGRAGAKDGLPSTGFALTVERDGRGQPKAVVLLGSGRGHGIGLCQWGARGRAQSGETERDILAAYYPGAVVVNGSSR